MSEKTRVRSPRATRSWLTCAWRLQALRLKRMASGQAVYMGKWEVTDEAVDVAMSELRKQAPLSWRVAAAAGLLF